MLSNRAILDQVASGQVDFGLIHSIMPAPDLRIEDVGQQRVMCIAPPGHRFARLRAVGCRDMAGETYVSYGRHAPFSRWLEEALRRDGGAMPASPVEVTASPALIEAVRLGVGIGLVESAALEQSLRRSLVVRPFAPALSLSSRIVRKPGQRLARSAERLSSLYRSIVLGDQPRTPC